MFVILNTAVSLKIESRKDTIVDIIIDMNSIIEPRHEISNNVVCATSKASDQPAQTCSLIRAIASRLNILLVLSY